MKKYIISIITLILIVILVLGLFVLMKNKTFFKDKYIGINNQEIFIPKYSYFKDECCMTAATFYSLRSKKVLEKEINKYMEDFKYFENDNTYGYQKDKLFIQKYEVIDELIYRKIVIVY